MSKKKRKKKNKSDRGRNKKENREKKKSKDSELLSRWVEFMNSKKDRDKRIRNWKKREKL